MGAVSCAQTIKLPSIISKTTQANYKNKIYYKATCAPTMRAVLCAPTKLINEQRICVHAILAQYHARNNIKQLPSIIFKTTLALLEKQHKSITEHYAYCCPHMHCSVINVVGAHNTARNVGAHFSL